jgi:hypothetical protein
MAAAKRNRKGQFTKARRASSKRARRRRSPASKLVSKYRAAVAGLFRRGKPARKRRKARNPSRRDARGRFLTHQRGLSEAIMRRTRLARGPSRRAATKTHALEVARTRRHQVARYRGLLGAPATNPPKKRKRHMPHLARNRKGQFLKRGAGHRRRRHSTVAVANPRRRRRHHARPVRHHRRRRVSNPMGGGLLRTVKASAMPMALGGLAGATAGFVDAKFLGDKATISILFKLGAALAGAALIGKRHPLAAAGWSGGLIGATGYYAGVKLGGGLVALNKRAALAGLADMAADDPDLAAQIAGLGDDEALGDVVDDGGLGDAAADYEAALADDETISDVVDE